jgi:hypothetical protein
VGAVGLLLLPQSAIALVQCVRQRSKDVILMVVLPTFLLVGVFSVYALPAVHGLQAISVVLLMLSLRWMQQKQASSLAMACVSAQIVINIALLLYRGHALVHG